jgi:putative sterol carrier protein
MGQSAEKLEAKGKEANATLNASLKLMNLWLTNQKYLCGNQISIADLSAANEISMLALIDFDLSPFPKVHDWMKRMEQLKNWNEVHKILNKVVAGRHRQPAAAGDKSATTTATNSSTKSAAFKSALIFDAIKSTLPAEGASFVKQIGAVFAFVINGANGQSQTWTLDFKNGNGNVTLGDSGSKADTTFTIGDDDFIAMATNKLSSQQAYLGGKLKLKGDIGKAMKFSVVLAKGSAKIQQALQSKL